jgi:hypothetical protein
VKIVANARALPPDKESPMRPSMSRPHPSRVSVIASAVMLLGSLVTLAVLAASDVAAAAAYLGR